MKIDEQILYLHDYISQVSRGEDVGPVASAGEVMDKQEQEASGDNMSSVLGRSREQILAAQFECYLKIIHDPPRTDEGEEVTDSYTTLQLHNFKGKLDI